MEIQLDVGNLQPICDDKQGMWYYDPLGARYVCLKGDKYVYNIPVEKFPTLSQFRHDKMRSLSKAGIAQYLPPDKLESMTMPRSQAVIKLAQHKELLDGNT